jgi:hypothetical protein
LDRESLLYFSKISEWAHQHIPHLWPDRLRDGLRDPNQHIHTLCEVWWLSQVVGAIYASVEHAVPKDPARPKGSNFDWRLQLTSAITLSLEVKRRPGDIGRFIEDSRLKPASLFDAIDKFGPARPPDTLNVGCIQLFGAITPEVCRAARAWLAATPAVSALALYAPCIRRDRTFAVLTQPGLGYIEHLFAGPDKEDLSYFAPVTYALSAEQFRAAYPGIDLPPVFS